MTENYYQALEVSPNATPQQIKNAYYKLSLKWHPQKNPQNRAQAQKKFNLINEAYHILSDPLRRDEYDQRGQTFHDMIFSNFFKRHPLQDLDDYGFLRNRHGFAHDFFSDDPFFNRNRGFLTDVLQFPEQPPKQKHFKQSILKETQIQNGIQKSKIIKKLDKGDGKIHVTQINKDGDKIDKKEYQIGQEVPKIEYLTESVVSESQIINGIKKKKTVRKVNKGDGRIQVNEQIIDGENIETKRYYLTDDQKKFLPQHKI